MQGTNIHFTRIIKIGDRLREFNFRKLPNTDNHYHVDVTDDRSQRIVFTLFPGEGNTWRISSQHLPSWILLAESKLGELIEEETNS